MLAILNKYIPVCRSDIPNFDNIDLFVLYHLLNVVRLSLHVAVKVLLTYLLT